MNTTQLADSTNPASKKSWKFTWPSSSLLIRLAVFLFLAFILNREGSKLLDVNVRYLAIVFWTLVFVMIVRRVIVGEQTKDEVGASSSLQNAASAPAKESPQEARLRLTAEMQAVTNWIGFMRFMWRAFILLVVFFLLYATLFEDPWVSVILIWFYCIWCGWRGWKLWIDRRRHQVWALAAQRSSGAIPTPPHSSDKKQSRSLLEKVERITLWIAISPIRLVVHDTVLAVESLTGFVINVFNYIKFIEPLLLYTFILPLRLTAQGLQHLDYMKQLSYDLLVVILLWCISVGVVLSIGTLI